MNDQKNKQQPGQGNQKNQGGMDQDQQKNQGTQGKMDQDQKDQKNPNAQQQKGSMADTHRQQPIGSDVENPDKDNDPDKKVNIDDDPDQTKRKVPNMGK